MADPKTKDEDQVTQPALQKPDPTPVPPGSMQSDPSSYEWDEALQQWTTETPSHDRPPQLSMAEQSKLRRVADRARRRMGRQEERREVYEDARKYPEIFGGGELSDFEQRQRAIEGLRVGLPEIAEGEGQQLEVAEAYETLKRAQQRNRGVRIPRAPVQGSMATGAETFGTTPLVQAHPPWTPRSERAVLSTAPGGSYRVFGASPPTEVVQKATRRRQAGEEITVADTPLAGGETPRQRLLGETVSEFTPTDALGVMRYDSFVLKNPTIPGMMAYIAAMKSRPEYTKGRSARIKEDIRRAEEFVKHLAATAVAMGLTGADIVSATKAYNERRVAALEEAPAGEAPAQKAVAKPRRVVKPAPAPTATPTSTPAPTPEPTLEPEPVAAAPKETAPITDPVWFDYSQW